MSEFVWIIEHYKQPFLGDRGISENYIINASEINKLQRQLIGSELWLIIRSKEDRCLGKINIKQVDKFIAGYYSGDYLIYSNREKSIKFCNTYEEAVKFKITGLLKNKIGISKINESLLPDIQFSLSNSIRIKLQKPDPGIFEIIKIKKPLAFGLSLAKIALSQITENYSLNQLWFHGAREKLPPIAYFAASLITEYWGFPLLPEMLNYLKDHDPVLNLIKSPPNLLISNNEKSEIKGIVDLEFTELNPDTIFARKLIKSKGEYDLKKAFEKTQTAEESHQAILRDIVLYLRSKSITAFNSTSIDLMINNEHLVRIFEIKSTSASNIFSQASKGAFQLAFYLNALKQDYESVEAILILQKIKNAKLLLIVINALKEMNIKALIYDEELDWPERINGLF